MAPVSSAMRPLTTSIEPEPSFRWITSFLVASKRPTTVTEPSDFILPSTGSPGVVTVLTPSQDYNSARLIDINTHAALIFIHRYAL